MIWWLLIVIAVAAILLGFIAVGRPEYARLGLIVISLGALFIGGCGLFFTGAALADWNYLSSAVLVFSVPSLIIGSLAGWLGWKKYRRTRQSEKTNDGPVA